MTLGNWLLTFVYQCFFYLRRSSGIISYASTDSIEQEKDHYHSNLQSAVGDVRRHDVQFLSGDFWERVGSCRENRDRLMGGHGTHVTDNGDSSSWSALYLMTGTTKVSEKYIVCPVLSGWKVLQVFIENNLLLKILVPDFSVAKQIPQAPNNLKKKSKTNQKKTTKKQKNH